ncbi:hypothetical protein [Streptomyces sp. AP-93]|uniref:hypothetical protein n=1 Tax=Streptomyces sp. AP-93 TaxID=2929048 RepID=UPI001FAFAA90|nr:hypothetical protein [Streptomyces sp. AP-93]MCJ0872592.1 hypothetical protein [Streptomyces sp. AP-93]
MDEEDALDGNSIVFVQRDEPAEVEYGGSKKLEGLARALDNARIFREFKNDDRAVLRAVTSGLGRHGTAAPAIDRALATLIDLATTLNEPDKIQNWTEQLQAIEPTGPERELVESEMSDPAALALWASSVSEPDEESDDT